MKPGERDRSAEAGRSQSEEVCVETPEWDVRHFRNLEDQKSNSRVYFTMKERPSSSSGVKAEVSRRSL